LVTPRLEIARAFSARGPEALAARRFILKRLAARNFLKSPDKFCGSIRKVRPD
jgi:hypothetical protein